MDRFGLHGEEVFKLKFERSSPMFRPTRVLGSTHDSASDRLTALTTLRAMRYRLFRLFNC